MSTWSPGWTMDQNRYGFLPRWFRTEIFNRCRLFLQVPIHLSCHIDSPPKWHWDVWEICFRWKAYHLLWWLTMDHPSMVKNSKRFAREFNFKHQTSSLHISISRMDSSIGHGEEGESCLQEDGWISKCSGKSIVAVTRYTLIAKDLPSPAEILHGWPAQGAVMPWRHRPVNIPKICWHLLEIQNTQKEHFDWPHRAKDERVLKVKEQVRFFPQKQYGAKLKWLTGTVVEILERGCSYIIKGPNGKKYRRNRAHLKPLCHDGSSFQDPPKAQKKNPSKKWQCWLLSRPQAKTHEKECIDHSSRLDEQLTPYCKHRHLNLHNMSNSKSTSHRVHSPRSPSSSPPAQLSSR